MKKSLFVAQLDFDITDENLRELFSAYGTVEKAQVVTDKFSGRSRGFGFVDMATPTEAQECINQLNNTTHKNRQLAVKFKEDKPAGGSSNPRGGFSKRW